MDRSAEGMRNNVKLGFVATIFVALLAVAGSAQKGNQSDSDKEIVGTVSCPVCVPKGAQKLDLVCARACLNKNPNAPGSAANASGNTSASAPGSSNPNSLSSNGSTPDAARDPDSSDKAANPQKSADNEINLVIIEDGDYKSFVVDNPEKLKSHLAHRVSVTGYWVNKKFHIVSVRTL